MPIELSLGPSRWARVWLDEFPPEVTAQASGILEGAKVAADQVASSVRRVAVDIRIPAGPHSYYAFIGVTFIPSRVHTFELDAAWTDTPQPVNFVVGGRPRKLKAGLTRGQAADAIKAITSLDRHALRGKATITHALVSDVDTSPVALRAATQVACNLIAEPALAESNDSLTRLVEAVIGTTIGGGC